MTLSYPEQLTKYTGLNTGSCREAIGRILREAGIKVVMLDDDPTGIQTVHSCRLITRWTPEHIDRALSDTVPFFYLLTNTRAMTVQEARDITRQAMQAVLDGNRRYGHRLIFVSRSDSTLRGHFPLETNVMAECLAMAGIETLPLTFFVPSFLEAGRYTIGGVHYLKEDDRLIPVSESEFARDNVFAYHHARLSDYIAEKTGRADFYYTHLGLDDFQSLSETDRLARLTEAVEAGKTHVKEGKGAAFIGADALQYPDLERFALSLLQYTATHREVLVIRSSSSLPKALSGIEDREILGKQDFMDEGNYGKGLFIVGSHVQKTTRQLERLLACPGTLGIELDVHAILDRPDRLRGQVLAQVIEGQRQGLTPVIYTSRRELRLDNADQRQRLGQDVSAFLVSLVRQLPYRPAYLIAKGGITSHDILTVGLNVSTATVMGQILKGVPCIRTAEDAHIPHLPYVIFPGNVGGEEALAEVYLKLR